MNVVVCGGRNFWDKEYIFKSLSRFHKIHNIDILINGASRGADALSAAWATENYVQVASCPANWTKYGRAAGMIRNSMMLNLNTDYVIAFPGGKGTSGMVRLAMEKRVKVVHYNPYRSPE